MLEKFKEVDYKANRVYIIYLACVNIFILATWYGILNTSYIETVSDFSFDGTDFSILANIPIIIFNKVLEIINFLMTSIFLLGTVVVIGIIFNRIYFKKLEGLPKEKRVEDIKVITLIISVITLLAAAIIYKDLFVVFIYLGFSLTNYLITKLRISKIYKGGHE